MIGNRGIAGDRPDAGDRIADRVVVGYETIGHRHEEAMLARAWRTVVTETPGGTVSAHPRLMDRLEICRPIDLAEPLTRF